MGGERHPLRINIRLPHDKRSSLQDLARITLKGNHGQRVPLAEPGRWQQARVTQTIYHKNLNRVAYVFGEIAGRPPAECIVDMEADRVDGRGTSVGRVEANDPKSVHSCTYFANGSGSNGWNVPEGIRVEFAGEESGTSRSMCSVISAWRSRRPC